MKDILHQLSLANSPPVSLSGTEWAPCSVFPTGQDSAAQHRTGHPERAVHSVRWCARAHLPNNGRRSMGFILDYSSFQRWDKKKIEKKKRGGKKKKKSLNHALSFTYPWPFRALYVSFCLTHLPTPTQVSKSFSEELASLRFFKPMIIMSTPASTTWLPLSLFSQLQSLHACTVSVYSFTNYCPQWNVALSPYVTLYAADWNDNETHLTWPGLTWLGSDRQDK